MKRFEVGKEYSTRSICNYDCVFTIRVTKRTDKTLWFIEDGRKERKTKIHADDSEEYIIPERYSMAPCWRADKEIN